jgi:hypothetical protein
MKMITRAMVKIAKSLTRARGAGKFITAEIFWLPKQDDFGHWKTVIKVKCSGG